MTTANNPYGQEILKSETPVPEWWKSKVEEIQEVVYHEVKRGEVQTLAVSPGGRKVGMAIYGDPEPELKGTANFNSALGSKNPDAYYRRGPGVRKRPVFIILAGVHGQEVEGMVGATSVIKIMETGKDIMGREQPVLKEKLEKLRLIVIPLANPDGRARVPYDGWVGIPEDEMTKYGQGTRKNGELYRWLPSKAIHPMKGDIGLLGAYFDDNGVNMMHDEWFAPMSNTTKALLELVVREGPDLVYNLHGANIKPKILAVEYVPVSFKQKLADFAMEAYRRLDERGIPHLEVPEVKEDGPVGTVPPAFNMSPALYHAGADLTMVIEISHGCSERSGISSYETILDTQHLLFEAAADYLLGLRKND